MKRILVYNWDRLDGTSGGGVSVYVRNLIDGLIKEGLEVVYLSSGLTYTSDRRLRIEKIENSFMPEINCYEIVNSPVIAPITQSSENIKKYLNDKKIDKLFAEFIKKIKPEIIHFNNFEGLSLETLKTKALFKDIKYIYSVHNYFPICSRVNLWKDEKIGNGHNCDKKSYSECSNCYKMRSYSSTIYYRCGNVYLGKLFKAMNMISFHKEYSDVFKEFEEKNISYINNYMDDVLAVSERVRELLINHGIDKNKIFTSYIGTHVEDNAMCLPNAEDIHSPFFKIVYMGYMRPEKGYYFFINSMKKLPDSYSKNIDIRIIARCSGKNTEISEINSLRPKFHNIELIDGYTKDNQRELLQECHLGIVPVLWEDNLPQVAIEQIAYGVPILVSDLGGAKELCPSTDFIFKAGNIDDFLLKLINIIDHREILNEFYIKSKKLVTMHEHAAEILRYYEE